MKGLKILALTVLATLFAAANARADEWWSRYDLAGHSDTVERMLVTEAGDTYVVGTASPTALNPNIFVARYDPLGSRVWQASYAGTANLPDIGTDLVLDPQGNLYVCGTVRTTGAGKNGVVLKYNSAGVLQWSYLYNDPSNLDDEFVRIQRDSAGNIVVGGRTALSSQNVKALVVKLTPAGEFVWRVRYDGSTTTHFVNDLKVDANNNVLAIGGTFISGRVASFLIKLNADGHLLWWTTSDDVDAPETFRRMLVTADGGVVVASWEDQPNSSRRLIVRRYTAAGNIVFRRASDEGFQLEPTSIALAPNGHYIVLGGAAERHFVASVRPDGVLAWMRYRDNSVLPDAEVFVDDWGDIYVPSYVPTSSSQIHILKLNDAGTLRATFYGLAGQISAARGVRALTNGQILFAGVHRSNDNTDALVASRMQPPWVQGEYYVMRPDTSLTVNASNGVLTNDRYVGNGIAILVHPPEDGSLSLHQDGSFSYTPQPGYSGTDTFTYRVSRGAMQSETASVVINIFHPLESLTIQPSTVRGGDQAVGTVTLTGPARPGGATVTLPLALRSFRPGAEARLLRSTLSQWERLLPGM
jgi:uncharacterized delta-60 repeat protein